MGPNSYKPTKKVIAAAVTGILVVVGHGIASGGFDATEWGELVTLGIALTGAYLRTNDDTAGGVPE